MQSAQPSHDEEIVKVAAYDYLFAFESCFFEEVVKEVDQSQDVACFDFDQVASYYIVVDNFVYFDRYGSSRALIDQEKATNKLTHDLIASNAPANDAVVEA